MASATHKPSPHIKEPLDAALKHHGNHTQSVLVSTFAMLAWMSCSTSIVLFNKLVLSQYGFDYPVALTLFHCAANSATLFLVYECGQLLPSPYRRHGAGRLALTIAPIAALFAVGTVLRTSAFVYLPVATIQLLSSGAPVVIYLMSCVTGLDTFHPALGVCVLAIAGGCVWAAWGSIAALATAPINGIVLQVSGLLTEALRGVMLKKIMVDTAASHSSLDLLYMMSPVAAAMLALPATQQLAPALAFIRTHGSAFQGMLAVNVMMAVCLNLSSFFFIKTCTVTTTSVAALAKDAFIIMGACALNPALLSANVVAGYGVTFAATAVYMWLKQPGRLST